MRKMNQNQIKKRVKKTAAVVIISALILSLLTVFVLGADLSEMIRVYRNQVILEVNNTRISTDNFLYNGTTYVPIRAVAQMLGKQVYWNHDTKVASITDVAAQTTALSKLLPSMIGYHWIYNGFAEYGHMMTLNSIVTSQGKRTYYISGEVDDPSGGESTADFSLLIRYIIEGDRLIQEKEEEIMLDSKFDRLIIIKAPLVVGNFWSEAVIDKDGNQTTITSQITNIEILGGGIREYTVRYSDQGSEYYEERILRDEVGVVSFEKLLELPDIESFPVTYLLYEPQDFESMNLTLYFPDNDAQYVWAEERSVMVYDNAVARAAIMALISGPGVNASRSIPEETTLLDIGILNEICTVNFSSEFVDNHPGGSAGELMTLASIVNTLTEFPTIQKVMILVDGKAGAMLGNIILDHSLERMTDMIGQ